MIFALHPVRMITAALVVAVLATAGCSATVSPSGTTASTAGTPSPSPPASLTLDGDTAPIHDPALIVSDGVWYVFSTGLVNREQGGTIRIARSHDGGRTWEQAGAVWDEIPAWIDRHYAGGDRPDNLWAPEVVEHEGTFYLYYSASLFGRNDSITALATNTTLDPDDPDYRWVDRGRVIASPASGLPEGGAFNAIDAGIVSDADGRPWMAIGSFWSGIYIVPLQWPSGKPVAGWAARAVHLADRDVEGNPIEAPYVVSHDGWFYLFVSFDRCCAGAESTYKIAMGRSKKVTGPYLDRDGKDLLGEGGGSILLQTDGDVVGPGGQSVFADTLAFHYYDGGNAYVPTLGLRTLHWVDGWPTLN